MPAHPEEHHEDPSQVLLEIRNLLREIGEVLRDIRTAVVRLSEERRDEMAEKQRPFGEH